MRIDARRPSQTESRGCVARVFDPSEFSTNMVAAQFAWIRSTIPEKPMLRIRSESLDSFQASCSKGTS